MGQGIGERAHVTFRIHLLCFVSLCFASRSSALAGTRARATCQDTMFVVGWLALRVGGPLRLIQQVII